MSQLSNGIWAKLIPLDPEKDNINLSIQPNLPNEYKENPEWKIYQRSSRETWISNLSTSEIRIDKEVLQMDQERELFGGEKVTFCKEKKDLDENCFDFIFCLTNLQSNNELKRIRNESQEVVTQLQKHVKMNENLRQELICSICSDVFRKCATLSPCQHTFCSLCIFNNLKVSTRCPLCQKEADSVTKHFVLQNVLHQVALANSSDAQGPQEKNKKIKEIDLVGQIKRYDLGIYVGSSVDGKKEGKGKFGYKEGQVYEGDWKDDQRHGEGILTLKDGKIYKGKWFYDSINIVMEIQYPDGNIYHGETRKMFQRGFRIDQEPYPQGYGKYFYKNGNEYDGKWDLGRRDGFGTMKYLNGDVYKGEWKEDKREGKGILTLKNGNKYDGHWLNDQKNGKGKYTWQNSEEYEGDFSADLRNGAGKMTYQDGSTYNGHWKSSKRNGEGTLTCSNGDIYKGIWVDNKRCGKGTFTGSGCQYEGYWSNNQKSGEGTMKYTDQSVYKGSWRSDTREGKGVLTTTNKDKYEGTWVADVIQPLVKIQYSNGDQYEGEIEVKSLQKQGKGVLISSNGDKYDGFWAGDKQQGQGKMIWKERFTYEGHWEDGEMNGEGVLTYAGSKQFKEWKKVEEIVNH